MKEKEFDKKLDDLIVVKRSGQRVDFNSTKIVIAIKNAFDQVMPINNEKKINKVYEDVLNYIYCEYEGRKTINVEDIQDIIERKLKENNFKEVYASFSEYRNRRAALRNAFGVKQQHKFTKAIERIVNDSSDGRYTDVAPNAVLLDFGKTISCEYTKSYVLDSKLMRAHEEGSIYIHNLDYFWLGKLSSTHLLFKEPDVDGFPNSLIMTALKCKDEIDGEIAINKIDSLLKPMAITIIKKEFYERLLKYLNVTDFIEYINTKKISDILEKVDSVNIDLDIFESLILNEKVKNIFSTAYQDASEYLISFLEKGLKELLLTLNDNNKENRHYSISIGTSDEYEENLITNICLNVLSNLKNLVNLRTIFKIRSDSDSELVNKVSELIIEKKNIAFSFADASYNKKAIESPEYFSNGKRIYENPIYELNSSKGRMIVSSISINMSRLGLKCTNKSLEEFYKVYSDMLDLTRNGLITIFEVIGDKTKRNYREIFNNNIVDDDKLEDDQKIRKIIKKGVLSLELAGLAECVTSLTDDEIKQKELIKDIIVFAENKCLQYTKESKLNFVVSETSKHRPLKKLMELDKAIYGMRKDITDKSFYGRLDNMFSFKKDVANDLKYIGEYQKHLNGGNFVKIILNKNAKPKNVIEIINLAKENNVGFLKIEMGE